MAHDIVYNRCIFTSYSHLILKHDHTISACYAVV